VDWIAERPKGQTLVGIASQRSLAMTVHCVVIVEAGA
jgi:hypothetical protein